MPNFSKNTPNIKTPNGNRMAQPTPETISFKLLDLRRIITINNCALLFFASSASLAEQPPAQGKCPAIAELLIVLSQKKVFEQTPELFLQTVTAQLKATKDATKALSSSEKMRTLTLAPTAGDWLNTGESVYTVVKDTVSFNSLTLEINKTCFSAPKELIELGQSAIGKGGKKIKLPAPDTTELIMWHWKDPDINMIRTLEISASKESYSIAVKRDPDSEGVAE